MAEACMSEIFGWWALGLESWRLGMDVASVVAMRSAKIAAGGAGAARESQLMVAEKVAAAAEIQVAFMTGGLGRSPQAISRNIVRTYGAKVRKNRRRLR
jgi:hypothetical protein